MSADKPRFEFFDPAPTSFTAIRFNWSKIAWYRRLWALIKIPYDAARLVIVGTAYFGHFRGRYKHAERP